MATSTAGTNTTTVLPVAIQWQRAGVSAADLATIAAAIKDYRINGNPIYPGALGSGQLFVPNRGFLKLIPGDWIAVGTTGWPYIIQEAAMTADWTHS